jgi:thioesterase domain-containing protein
MNQSINRQSFFRYKNMIGVNVNGTRKPIFWAPGLPGRAEWFLPLACSLEQDFPSYGFDSPSHDKNHSVEQTAAMYIEMIQNIQPTGPYMLGGYSFGGAVIYEIMRQLQKKREKVSHIIFLDCYAPSSSLLSQLYDQIDQLRMAVLITNVVGLYWEIKQPLNLDILKKANTNNWIEFLTYYLFYHSNHPFVKEEEFTNFLRHCFLDGLQNYAVLKNYHPSKYNEDVKLILLQSEKGFTGKDGSFATHLFNPSININEEYYYFNGWNKFFTSSIKSIFLSCDHFELIVEPYVKDIAKILYEEIYV